MDLNTQVLIDWYKRQYDKEKEILQRDCMSESFWDMAGSNAEERLIERLMHMMQMQYRIEGLKEGGEDG